MGDPQGVTPDPLSSLPRLQTLTRRLRIGVNELRSHLRNQGVWVGADDRVPEEVVYAALQAELDAGRPWKREEVVL